ncbi:hypothetical protein ACFP8W_11865, partial [Nocardioides hankookensis]
MRFDGPLLARAWLSVAAAAEQKLKLQAQLYKAVTIEEYSDGVRLVATDRTVLLTAWVPDLDSYYDGTEPEPEIAPERVTVAADVDGRARSMLGHILSLANRIGEDEYTPGEVRVDVDFNVRVPAGTGGAQAVLEGMDPTYVVLASPDVEKVYVPAVDGGRGVDWRTALGSHTAKSTSTARYDPELLERLCKVRSHAGGPLQLGFGGKGGTTRVYFVNSDPLVHGLLMPARDDSGECRTCAEGAPCLRHGA